MTNSKGFTITELLVAIGLLAIVMAAAASFFKYQSSVGKETARRKSVREDVALAMFMLKNDILHAGYGVGDKNKLAVMLNDPVTTSSGWDAGGYRKLYVNYGRFLNTSVTTTAFNVFFNSGYFDGADVATYLSSNLDGKFTQYDMDTLLQYNEALAANAVSVFDLDYSEATSQFSPGAGATVTTGRFYAPAISYVRERADTGQGYDPDHNPYVLKRNGQTIFGGQSYVSDSSDPNLRRTNWVNVTNFWIRARFVGSPDYWSPDGEDGHQFNKQNLSFLRYLEATLEYQLKSTSSGKWEKIDPASNTPLVRSKTIRVTPRGMVLQRY